MYLHQIDPLLYAGNDNEHIFNRELYTCEITSRGEYHINYMTLPTGTRVMTISSNPITLEAVMPRRPFVVCDVIIPLKGICFRQPFYRSSGRATPNVSPEGTWQPFSCVYTSEYADKHGMFLGWIAKKYWTPGKVWIDHHKTRDTIPNGLLTIMDKVCPSV